MSNFLQDLRYGVRTLRKSPGFTIIALATLALALGANTAIFSFVNAVLLKPLPYDQPERIMRVLEAPPGGGRNGISTLNFLDWKKENTVFEFLVPRTGGSATLTGVEEPVLLPGTLVGADFFRVFTVKLALGRTFAPDEDQPGKDRVLVMSYGLWQTQFGGAADILGRKLQLNGEPYEVIGVLAKDSPFERSSSKIWRPLVFKLDNMTRDYHWFNAIGRLKPGVTLEQARANMDAIGKRISQDYPASNKGWGIGVDPFAESIVGKDLRRSLFVLLAAVGMVLLIACANLANLSLMRVVGREREIAVRTALGAGRWTLARQFLTESMLLSAAGGVAGLAFGYIAMRALQFAMPPFSLPIETSVALDWRVGAFAFLLALITGAIVGLFPAWQAAKPNLMHSLKQGGGAGTGHGHARMRSALVVLEVALAFVLLAGAGLLMRSLDKLNDVDLGFNPNNVLTFRLPLSNTQYPDAVALNTRVRDLTDRLAALPGVSSVATSSVTPLRGWGYGMGFTIAEGTRVDRANRRSGFFKMVSPSYFQTLQIRLVKGRLLQETDVNGGPPVMVINETMAKREFPGQDPIGQHLLVQKIIPGKTSLGDEIPWEIVGIVGDEKPEGLDEFDESPGMYVSQAQSPIYGRTVVMRTQMDPNSLREAVKKTVRDFDKNQTLPDMNTLAMIKQESLGDTRFRTLLLGSFAGVSLLLSAVGIYGVISYSVTQRTREIGIRAALGASRGDVLRLVLRHGMMLCVLGLLIGIAGASGLTQFLGALLFGISGRDPLTLLCVAALLGAVALLACFVPAHRATRVSPVIALRSD